LAERQNRIAQHGVAALAASDARAAGKGLQRINLVTQLNHDAFSGLFADPVHRADPLDVAFGDGSRQLRHGEAAEHAQRQFGADPVDVDQALEHPFLFRLGESEQNLRVFADMVVGQQAAGCAGGGQAVIGVQRDEHLIADTLNILGGG